jgi:hypothetical protein
MFYDRTKKRGKTSQAKKAQGDSQHIRKMRKNLKLHQRPLTTGRRAQKA